MPAPAAIWRLINRWGEQNCFHSPRMYVCCGVARRLRGELCSALGAATGEDLAAVGGSHSLSEAMHLGSVTLSGLIGTNSCHGIYTSCKNMLNSEKPNGSRRSESEYSCSYGAYKRYYSRYGHVLSIFFCTSPTFSESCARKTENAQHSPAPAGAPGKFQSTDSAITNYGRLFRQKTIAQQLVWRRSASIYRADT